MEQPSYNEGDVNGKINKAERIENPVETSLRPSDLVRILVGPAEGNLGIVIIERNGNYANKEINVDDESIGVSVIEETPVVEPLKDFIIKFTGNTRATKQKATRWFDSSEQLELVYREEEEQKVN